MSSYKMYGIKKINMKITKNVYLYDIAQLVKTQKEDYL